MIACAVKTAQNKLMEAGFAFEGDFIGCTQMEILSIEDRFAIQLPSCYRDFLGVMGRRAGALFLAGSDYSFPTVLRFRNDAEELLRKCLPEFKLPPTVFVFISHQGYNYSWFNCGKPADDPPVFLFTEGEKEPRMVSDSFSTWLLSAVDDDIAAYRELYKS
jgi:hypothetical protein